MAAWEQRKLREFGSVEMCKRIYKEQTSEHGEVPFFKIGTFGGVPDAFISRTLFEEYRALYPYPKLGALLISAAGSIGRIVKYAGEEAYYQDSNIVWLEHNELLDDEFLAAVFDRHDWTALEGSTIKRLYNKDLLDFKLLVPTVSEQRQIGSFFSCLDDLITLHQRKQGNVWHRNGAWNGLTNSLVFRTPLAASSPSCTPTVARMDAADGADRLAAEAAPLAQTGVCAPGDAPAGRTVRPSFRSAGDAPRPWG